MCSTCDEAAEVVSKVTEGEISPEVVLAVVRAFRDVSMELVREDAEVIADVTMSEVVIRPGASDQEAIPKVLLEALVASVGGPVVVIGATPDPKGGNGLVHLKAAGPTKDTKAMAERLCTVALETLQSPLAQTGGFTEDGRLVMPMVVSDL